MSEQTQLTVAERDGGTVWFSVRAGWEWGNIFVRPLDGGAEVLAHSSFGLFGYTWSAMGEDWRAFLLSCSREYAMRKMAGKAYDVPLDRDEFVALMTQGVDEHEKAVNEAWGFADPDQQLQIDRCREALEDQLGWEDVPLEVLFWHFNNEAGGAPYSMELYEARMTKINPQVVGFWDTIWTPFCDHLAIGIEAGTGETRMRLDPKDESPAIAPKSL